MLGHTVRAKHLIPGWGSADAVLWEAGCSGKSVHPGSGQSEPKDQLERLLAPGPWARFITSLFCFCQRGRTGTYICRAESGCDNFAHCLAGSSHSTWATPSFSPSEPCHPYTEVKKGCPQSPQGCPVPAPQHAQPTLMLLTPWPRCCHQ